jgi:hypothetical protein
LVDDESTHREVLFQLRRWRNELKAIEKAAQAGEPNRVIDQRLVWLEHQITDAVNRSPKRKPQPIADHVITSPALPDRIAYLSWVLSELCADTTNDRQFLGLLRGWRIRLLELERTVAEGGYDPHIVHERLHQIWNEFNEESSLR